jgi:hypothetical protein
MAQPDRVSCSICEAPILATGRGLAQNGPMPLPHERPENRGVLTYLGQGADPAQVTVQPPGPDVDTWRLGAHPDVVQRLWDQLAPAMPGAIAVLAGHTAALLGEGSGLLVAVALGTEYAIRLPEAAMAAAQDAGYATVHRFATVDRALDLAATFGPGWVFGQYDEREAGWMTVFP